MAQINAHLNFNGNCREAMTFYQSIFGGDLELQIVGESPMAAQFPPGAMNNVLHAGLTNGSLMLFGSDMGGPNVVNGNSVSLSLTCNSEDDMRTTFAALSAGGKDIRDIHDFFAGKLGALTDKYGTSWILYFN